MITDRKEDSLMIGKIRKGRSFGGCIRYVTQKDDAEIIASEGVLLGTAEETARSFRWQCLHWDHHYRKRIYIIFRKIILY